MTSITTPIGLHEIVAAPIRLDGDRAIVEHLVVADPSVVSLLATAPVPDRAELAERMMSVGARGLASMGIGIDLGDIDERVQAVLDNVAGEAERTVRAIIDESRISLSRQFDPEQRSSILARALADFTRWRDEFLTSLDPGIEGSPATELLSRLQHLVGPDGALEHTIEEALDLDCSDSGLARLSRSIDERFEQLRRDLAGHRAADAARDEEAERGTAHGLAFEDVVESNLRNWAATVPGSIVERTATTPGELGSAKVGDFVVVLPDAKRIVIEAKRHASITLSGSGGILAELDAAIANRRADAALCIAGRDAFPTEVGHFNVYGDRVLVVDEGDGAMTAVALQWLAASTAVSAGTGDNLDAAAVVDRLDRIRKAAEELSGARRTVTSMRNSLERLHEHLGTLRGDLLDQVGDLDRLTRHDVGPTSERHGSEPIDS